jgi:tRNA pseudouridine55 synthase
MRKFKPHGREINGFLLLDKPIGLSSNQALQRVKSLFFAQKAGHTGSLDPLATGMLPICFGEATKFSQFLLDADKHYQTTAQLGIKTNTCDSEGDVLQTRDASGITLDMINKALPSFRGEIMQVPSMFSALKHQGQPLYKLARQGIEVERAERKVIISSLKILDFSPETHTLTLDIQCSKGTYIRNLVDDLGEALGCGAHVIMLRRLGVAQFTQEQMISMETLDQLRTERAFSELDTLILPLESIATILPALELTTAAAFKIQQGHTIENADTTLRGLVSLYMIGNKFIGIGEISAQGEIIPKRLISQD